MFEWLKALSYSGRNTALAVLFCFATAGCSDPYPSAPTPSEELRKQLGVVGIRVSEEKLEPESANSSRGGVSTHAKGAAVGIVRTDAGIQGISSGGDFSGGPPVGLVVAAIVLPVALVVGGADALIETNSEVEAKNIEQNFVNAVSNVSISGEMCFGISQALYNRVSHPVKILKENDPRDIDSVLDIRVHRVGFAHGSAFDPKVTLFVESRFKIYDVSTGQILLEDSVLKLHGSRLIDEWLERDADHLRTALSQVYRESGTTIVEEVFLVRGPRSK